MRADVECGLDWVQGFVPSSLPGEDADANIRAVGAVLQQFFSPPESDLRAWFPFKSRVGYGEGVDVLMEDTTATRVYVSIRGAGWARLSSDRAHELMSELERCQLVPTRLDLRADDFTRVIEPLGLLDYAEGGKFSGPRSWRMFRTGGTDTSGTTIQFGSAEKGSRGFLRVYDKNAESGGKRNCVRWEYVARDVAAVELWRQLVQMPHVDGWARTIGGYVFGFVTFWTNEKGAGHLTRLQTPGWLDALRRGLRWGPSGDSS